MNSPMPLRKLGMVTFSLLVALPLAQLKCAAFSVPQQEQQRSQQPAPPSPTPPPSSQPSSKPAPPIEELPVKRRRVWTNDDVVQIRTPADNYEIEKEAKEAADAQAAAKDAAIRAAIKSEKQTPLDIKLPATVEETERMLKVKQGEIQEETVILQELRKELQNAPAEEQPQKQKDIDRLTALIETSQRDIRALQDHLQTLRGKPQEENPPAPPQPPSP